MPETSWVVSGFTEVLTLTSDVMILQENTLIILTLAAKVTLGTPFRAEHFNFIVQLTLFIMDTEVSEEHLRHT